MARTYARCNLDVKPDLLAGAFICYAARSNIAGMAGTYLREWRLHRGLTQSQVLDRFAFMDDPVLPRTGASLSRLETGKQPYSQRVLEALADVYDTQPGHLISHHPAKEGKVIDLVAKLDERRQAQAVAIIEALMTTESHVS